jgi:SAM-dependent methyltransferase
MNHTSLHVECANYFNASWPDQGLQDVLFPDSSSPKKITFAHFNIEQERFPYADRQFDVLLMCEILEHLQNDPVSCLRECSRVLKQDGWLIVTTPNVSRLENVARMIAGVNMYDPYSGYGPYGRHNREYNKHELFQLLTYCGFQVDVMFTADVHDNRSANYFSLASLIPLVKSRQHDLGQYLFVRARKTSEPKPKRPSWLYRSYAAADLE